MEQAVDRGSNAFGIGEHRVVPLANEIDGAHVDSKAMDVLVCLAEAAPDVVTNAALFERVWPKVVVGDNVLHQAIAQLRRALGDDARSPRCIENIPRRGYRVIAPVEWSDTADKVRTQTEAASPIRATNSAPHGVVVQEDCAQGRPSVPDHGTAPLSAAGLARCVVSHVGSLESLSPPGRHRDPRHQHPALVSGHLPPQCGCRAAVRRSPRRP